MYNGARFGLLFADGGGDGESTHHGSSSDLMSGFVLYPNQLFVRNETQRSNILKRRGVKN
jgi:hypothetical protein